MRGIVPASAILLAAIMWGTWWWPMRLLDSYGLSVDWASLVIYVLATASLAPIAWARRQYLRDGGWLLVGVGVSMGTLLVLWNVAIVLGDVVRVTLLFYLAPIWATLLARFVLKEPVSKLRGASILAGMGGAAVVLGFPGETGLPLPKDVGDWMGVVCGVLFATSLTFARMGYRVSDDGKTEESLGGFEQSFAAFVFAMIAAAVFTASETMPAPTNTELVGSLPLAALFALAWLLPQTVLFLWGAARFDPGRTSILMLMEVIAAAVSATILSGDILSWRDVTGCVLIIVAAVLEAESMRRTSVAAPA